MPTQIQAISSLERKLSVEVPAEEISALVDAQIKKLMQTARVDGFRKGKATYKIIQTRYGDQVFSEVLQETLTDSLRKAFDEHKLVPVGQPHIENLQAGLNEKLSYDAMFDIYPTIKLADMDKIKVERRVVQVSDADIDATIEQLRKREANWNPVNRPAQNGDKLFADVTLESEGYPTKDMKRLPVELGSKTMIAGFEDGLLNTKVGDEIILNLAFPTPYFEASLAGKPAKFTVKVLEVLGAEPPNDEELLEKLAIEGGMDVLRAEIREHIEKEVKQYVQTHLKQEMWNKLLDVHAFELPKSLIEQELHRIIHPNESHEDAHTHHDATQEQKTLAERQVKLGLLVAELIKHYDLKVDSDRVRAKVETIVSSFKNPDEMAKYYVNNEKLFSEIKSMVLEDQLIDVLLEKVTLVDKPINYAELSKNSAS